MSVRSIHGKAPFQANRLVRGAARRAMKSSNEKARKEDPPSPRDLESRRIILEELAAVLRAFMNKLRRMLN